MLKLRDAIMPKGSESAPLLGGRSVAQDPWFDSQLTCYGYGLDGGTRIGKFWWAVAIMMVQVVFTVWSVSDILVIRGHLVDHDFSANRTTAGHEQFASFEKGSSVVLVILETIDRILVWRAIQQFYDSDHPRGASTGKPMRQMFWWLWLPIVCLLAGAWVLDFVHGTVDNFHDGVGLAFIELMEYVIPVSTLGATMLAIQAQCLRHRERLQSYVDSQGDDAPRMLDFLITEEEEINKTSRRWQNALVLESFIFFCMLSNQVAWALDPSSKFDGLHACCFAGFSLWPLILSVYGVVDFNKFVDEIPVRLTRAKRFGDSEVRARMIDDLRTLNLGIKVYGVRIVWSDIVKLVASAAGSILVAAVSKLALLVA